MDRKCQLHAPPNVEGLWRYSPEQAPPPPYAIRARVSPHRSFPPGPISAGDNTLSSDCIRKNHVGAKLYPSLARDDPSLSLVLASPEELKQRYAVTAEIHCEPTLSCLDLLLPRRKLLQTQLAALEDVVCVA